MSRVPTKTVDLVKARAWDCCEVCGVHAYGGSIHHRRPRGMGGSRRASTSAASNLLLLCGSGTTGCHGMVERDRAASLDNGRLVLQGHDPATTPVLLAVGRVLLAADGTYTHLEGTS